MSRSLFHFADDDNTCLRQSPLEIIVLFHFFVTVRGRSVSHAYSLRRVRYYIKSTVSESYDHVSAPAGLTLKLDFDSRVRRASRTFSEGNVNRKYQRIYHR